MTKVDQVDYAVLDRAKVRFIEASARTVDFALPYGRVENSALGASANIFSLEGFVLESGGKLCMTLLPEGLGTADDTRPSDLSAQELRRFWHGIGGKTVACLTNDVASGGCRPLLIGLYLPSSTPETVFTESFLDGFLEGIVSACRTVGCVYLSGETPQLRGKIVDDKIDIAGSAFGIMPPAYEQAKGRLSGVSAGASIVLVASNGPHENGFTPLRTFASRLQKGLRTQLPHGEEMWEALCRPSVLYSPLVETIIADGIFPLAFENISGHGWLKLMRSKTPLRYVIERILPVPLVFSFLEQEFSVSPEEMITTFNYGAGFAIYTHTEDEARRVVTLAESKGLAAIVAGYTEASSERVLEVEPLNVTLSGNDFLLKR
jgi:phosphoribosylformylglycinamidine cyclo-ligase